jgi:hypothetical protein
MKAEKSKEEFFLYYLYQKILKQSRENSILTNPVPKPLFLDPPHFDPDRSQNVHLAGLSYKPRTARVISNL